MPDFIAPIVSKTIDVLKARTPVLLQAVQQEPFADYRAAWTGVVENFPAVFVSPMRTTFDAPSQNTRHQSHQLRVKLAISASDPDSLASACLAYVKAVDDALAASDPVDWAGALRVFISAHDYGALWQQEGGVLAYFPEILLVIETEEV